MIRDMHFRDQILLFSDKVTCMKIANYMHQAMIRSYFSDINEVPTIIKKLGSKVFIICKRRDIKYFLESRIFVYRNQSNVMIFRKTGSPRCLSIAENIVKVPVTNFALKGTKLFEDIVERLRLKNILKTDDKILA